MSLGRGGRLTCVTRTCKAPLRDNSLTLACRLRRQMAAAARGTLVPLH